jgi:hypothetical protein
MPVGKHESRRVVTDEVLTDPDIIKAFGEFDLDPCSPIVRPWDTAKHHYSKLDDGLVQPWFGRVWMNPPFGDVINLWLARMVEFGNGITYTFARTETDWYFRYGWEQADAAFFLRKRPYHYDVLGNVLTDKKTGRKINSGGPISLFAYGEENYLSLRDCDLDGKFVPLRTNHIIVVGISPSWFSVVSIACREFGDAEMQPVYDMVSRIAPDKVSGNQHWKEKVRQKVQEFRKRQIPVAL